MLDNSDAQNLKIHSSVSLSQGNLRPKDIRLTDLYNIDSGGKTLVMAAAAGNRCDNLNILFKYKDCPINAQNVTVSQHHRNKISRM